VSYAARFARLFALAVLAAGAIGCPQDDDSGPTAASPEQQYQTALTQCQQWAAGTLYPGISALFVKDWAAVYASPEFKMLVDSCMHQRGYDDSLTGF